MTRGTVINSTRDHIWDYQSGPTRNRNSELHPDFVSQRLVIGAGLEISRSDLGATYLEWVQAMFDPDLTQAEHGDLHNLYLHLLRCHGVIENEPRFRWVGLRP